MTPSAIDRNYVIAIDGKGKMRGSADPMFRGDGSLQELAPDGGGKFTRVTLVPSVTITEPDREQDALRLHDDAHRLCFIAQSSSVPINHSPTVRVESA